MKMYKYTMQIRKSEAQRCINFFDTNPENINRVLYFEGKSDDLYLFIKSNENGMFEINNNHYGYSEIIDIYASIFYEHKINVICGFGNCIPTVIDRRNRIQFVPLFESYYDIKIFFSDNGTVTVLVRDIICEFGLGNFSYRGEVEYNEETNEISSLSYTPADLCY